MRREGREVLLDLLLVSDIRHDSVVERNRAALVEGQRKSHARHERRETRALQGQRLATGVGSRDDEQIELLSQAQIQGDHLRQVPERLFLEQEWMAKAPQAQALGSARFARKARHASVRVTRVARPDEGQLELADALGAALDVVAIAHHLLGQLGQDAVDLALGVGLETRQVVGPFDDLARLYEDRLSAGRAIVHDARQSARLTLSNRQHAPSTAPVDLTCVTLRLGLPQALAIRDLAHRPFELALERVDLEP